MLPQIVSLLILLALFAGIEWGASMTQNGHTPPRKFKSYRGNPTLAFGDTDAPLNPADVQDFGSKDTLRIVGNISRALVRKAPYMDVLEGGTLENVSDTVRSIVQERAVLNQSLVNPVFQNDLLMAGQVGAAAEVGTTEYQTYLGTLRGMGPLVNVKQTRTAFAGSYSAAEDALKKEIIQLTNADIRATLMNRSGCKLVVNSNGAFEDMFLGDSQLVDTPFPVKLGLPDSPVNFSLLKWLAVYMRENLLVEPYDTQPESTFKLIGSQEILDVLRDEAGIREDHRYLAAGSFKIGEETLRKYTWEGPYRGYAFGVDSQPLRFSVVDNNGQPVFIEPEIAVNSTKGVAARVNPAWARARYECLLVMGQNSFRKLNPKSYAGEGTFKFPTQLVMGELMFQVIKDNSTNVWGDYGRHFYQIQRAYKPERPHAVCAIIYKRASKNFGLTPVSDYSNYSSLASL